MDKFRIGFSLNSKNLNKGILILNKRVILHKCLVLFLLEVMKVILVLCAIFANKF